LPQGWGFVISATFTVAIVEREPALAGQGALAWALVGLAAMPAVFLWDKVARRYGDTRALLLAFGLQTVSVILPALSGSLAAALGGALGYGATFIGIVSLTLALVGRRAPHNPGKAMARLTLSYGAAQVIAPIVAGAMAQATGTFKGALWLTAGVMLLGMAFAGDIAGRQNAICYRLKILLSRCCFDPQRNVPLVLIVCIALNWQSTMAFDPSESE
jgi:MFS family permease